MADVKQTIADFYTQAQARDFSRSNLFRVLNINFGDGSTQVIGENDLVYALKNNLVSGAGLDVFENEPLSVDSPLRKMSNVFLASHNSNSSPSCWENVHINSVQMLIKELGI